MTLVRFKNRPVGHDAFNNLLSDVLPQFPSMYREDLRQAAPVNIRERETEYLIDMLVPGWNKEDFKISLEKNLLTIAADKKDEAANDTVKNIRREFRIQSFKRSFTVDEKVNADAISAQYVNGVLTLNLPKKEEVKPSTKQISIN